MHVGQVFTPVYAVHLSQVGVLQRWLKLGPQKQRHTIAQGL